MAVTPNLNLYLSSEDDYVSNERDLNDNFEKIDTAVGEVQTSCSRKNAVVICPPNTNMSLPFVPYITLGYWYTSLDACIPFFIFGHDGNQWHIFDRHNNDLGTVSINNSTLTNSTNLYLILLLNEL